MFFGNGVTKIINGENTGGFTGEGVGIAVMDTGVSAVNDFTSPQNRIRAFKDFVNGKTEPYDDNGHGSHETCAIARGFLREKRKKRNVGKNPTLLKSVYCFFK